MPVSLASALVSALADQVASVVLEVDLEELEDRLVEPFLRFVWRGVVELDRTACEPQDRLKSTKQEFAIALCRLDQRFGLSHLSRHLKLTRAQIFNRNRFGQIGVDQSLLGVLQILQALRLLLGERVAGQEMLVEQSASLAFERRDGLFTEGDLASPLGSHGLLDLLDRDIRQVAVRAPGVASEAEEVLVDTASSFGLAVAHPPLAAPTDQRPLEEVRVPPRPIAAESSARQHVLDFEPGRLIDERFVGTVQDHALVDDLADVVRLTQHAVHLRVGQWPTFVLASCPTLQSPLR